MGKRFFDLYENICHPLNLWAAYKNAARGKRYQPAAAAFEYDLEENLIELENELKEETYQPGGYHNFLIQRPKRRLISAAPFRDRVVHHALMNVIEPFFERQFIFDSYANRKGKGTHAALDRCTYFMRRYRYVMHLDVRQFFPSIDHQILLSILSRTIADERTMALITKIIASGKGIQMEEYDMAYFPNDDLLAVERPRGLPIGNLTSQHFANFLLGAVDHYALQTLRVGGWVRYMDDMLLLGPDKACVRGQADAIAAFLCDPLHLAEKRAARVVAPVHTGIPFLGFRVWPRCVRLDGARRRRFLRRAGALARAAGAGAGDADDLGRRGAALFAWVEQGDTLALRCSVVGRRTT